MKTIRTITIAFGAMSILFFLITACSKAERNEQENEMKVESKLFVSVTGVTGEYSQYEDTKSELVSNIRVKWSAGDKVYAYDGTKCLGTLNVSLRDGSDYYAVLSGNLEQPEHAPGKITLIHSNAMKETPAITEGNVKLSISSQNVSSSSECAPFLAYGTIDYNESSLEVTNAIVNFTLASSVMRLNCTGLEANDEIKCAKLRGMSNECVLNLSSEGAVAGQGAIGDISLQFESGFKASANGAQVIYAAIAPNSAASEQTIEIQQTKTYEYAFGSRTREATKSINAICQMRRTDPLLPYVEIGGLKWATMNLGATTVAGNLATCAGDYYAWGETETYYGSLSWSGTSATFSDWKSNKDSGYSWKSYCGAENFKEWDPAPYYYILTDKYDVVRQKIGNGWRMPSAADFKKLYDACINSSYDTSTKPSGSNADIGKGIYWCDSYDGVAGCLFCDGTNKLFFPAAHCVSSTSLDEVEEGKAMRGRYWSNTIYSGDWSLSYYLYFYEEGIDSQSFNPRYYGYSIRPVSD